MPLLSAILAGGFGLVASARAQGGAGSLTRLEETETSLNAQRSQNENRLSRLLTVLMRFRSDPPPALLVSPDDASRAIRAAILVKAITPQLQARAKVYALAAQEIARQRRLVATASAATFSTESDLAEEVRTDPVGSGLPRVLTPPRSLDAPVKGPILHGFGDVLAGGDRANGVVYLAAERASVGAPQGGLVQYAGPVKGWGVILILRMAGGYHLVLAGLERSNVAVGQVISTGAEVGVVGSGGPKALYLEVRAGSDPVDPTAWLKAGRESKG